MRRRIRRREEDRKEERREETKNDKSSCCAAIGSTINFERKERSPVDDKKTDKKYFDDKLILSLAVIGIVLLVFGQIQLLSIQSAAFGGTVATGITMVSASVIPKGIPKIYGEELDISYDDIDPNNPTKADATIGILRNYDESIKLTGEDLERYIDIASQISCEYCCGAQSIIVRREDIENLNKQIEAAIESGKITEEQAKTYRKQAGDLACGCAHSYAMRGLAKYLITEHGTEFTDEEILDELGKWKTLFFPTQMAAKAQALEEKNIEFSYSNLGSNEYRGIEKSSAAGGNMVGGC